MNKTEYEFKVSAGIVIRKTIMKMIQSEIFYGRQVRFLEDKGFISSIFSIRGNYDDAKMLENRIQFYICANKQY